MCLARDEPANVQFLIHQLMWPSNRWDGLLASLTKANSHYIQVQWHNCNFSLLSSLFRSLFFCHINQFKKRNSNEIRIINAEVFFLWNFPNENCEKHIKTRNNYALPTTESWRRIIRCKSRISLAELVTRLFISIMPD